MNFILPFEFRSHPERYGSRCRRPPHALVRLGLITGSFILVSCRDDSGPTMPEVAPPDVIAPLVAARGGDPIPDRYIVVFKQEVKDVRGEVARQVAAHKGRVHFTYTHALKGYAVTLPAAAVRALRSNPTVQYIEQDQLAHASETQNPTPSWGLDRVDQRDLPLNNSYSYLRTGAGVRVYIIDTGIRTSHSDFGGRAVPGANFIGDGNGTNDCEGHGTHVAGTVGGRVYGIAKGATLVAVRVLGCDGSGPTSGVIAGVDWVTANGRKPAVSNMSLGGGLSFSLNNAVTRSINSGILFAVSAGNSNLEACSQSPSSTPAALTVAATARTDARAPFSNWGSCVDLFAPGVSIVSDYNGSDGATASLSGTSMAAPHVAGAAALYLQQNPSATSGQITQALVGNATIGKVISPGVGTPNRLLYMGFLNGPALGGSWTQRTSLPSARRGHAVWVVNGLLYAIGGLNSVGTVVNAVTAYNPSTNSWTSKASLPAARQTGNGAATINGIMYLAGGHDAARALTRTLYAYNAATNTWSTKAAMPVFSSCGGSAAYAGKLYVFSGCTRSSTGGQVATGLLHRYDPGTNTWTTLPRAPAAHFEPVVAVTGGKLYVVGGNNGSGAAFGRVDMYNPATNTWSMRATMPTARVAASGAAIGGKLQVIGGRNGNNYLTTVEAYDPLTNTWSTRTSMPTGRAAFGVGGISGFLYAVGGRDIGSTLSANERYAP